jgi:striatin 1/3/4
VGTSGWKSTPLPPSRITAIQDDDAKSRDEKEGSQSGDDDCMSPTSARWLLTFVAVDKPKLNGVHAPAMKGSTIASRASETGSWKNLGGGVPRDPKSRARSREYLKQFVFVSTMLDWADLQ